MSEREPNLVSEAARFGALRGDLPLAEATEAPVKARLVEVEAPKGVILRFADWTGVRGRAASIVGPVLLPLGLTRPDVAGAATLKAALPKSLLSSVAMPFAVLLMVGMTLHLSLRKTVGLRGEGDDGEEAARLQAQWWSERRRATVVFTALLMLVALASPKTAKMVLYLTALVSHAFCADLLSRGRTASRRAVAISAFNIGSTLYLITWVMAIGTATLALALDVHPSWAQEHRSIAPRLLGYSAAALTLGVVTFAAVQGRSSLLRPWKFLTEATHLDIARLAALVLIVLSLPALAASGFGYVQQLEGSVGSCIWESRATLAWLAFCFHAMVLVKRAPLD